MRPDVDTLRLFRTNVVNGSALSAVERLTPGSSSNRLERSICTQVDLDKHSNDVIIHVARPLDSGMHGQLAESSISTDSDNVTVFDTLAIRQGTGDPR